MLETKKKVFAITNSWSGNFVSRHISKPPCTTAQGRRKRGAGVGRAHASQCLADQFLKGGGGLADNAPNYYLPLPPPDFQTYQNPCCSVPRGFPSSILSVFVQGHLKQEVYYIVAAYQSTLSNGVHESGWNKVLLSWLIYNLFIPHFNRRVSIGTFKVDRVWEGHTILTKLPLFFDVTKYVM